LCLTNTHLISNIRGKHQPSSQFLKCALKESGKIEHPNTWTLSYDCQSLFYSLEVFDNVCAPLVTLYTPRSYSSSIHTLCCEGDFPFTQITCPTELVVKRIHGWLLRADPLQVLSDSVAAFIPHIKPFSFCRCGAIFSTAVPLAADHCNCMCTL
jgi:hypothetical protein